MPRRPLLAIVVSADEANTLHVESMGSGELRINPALDNEVSLRAQTALANASPSFAAELTATTHFVENLERITRDEVTARISDVGAGDGKVWTYTEEQILRDVGVAPSHHRGTRSSSDSLVRAVIRRARERQLT